MIRQTADSIISALDDSIGYYCIDSVNIPKLNKDYLKYAKYFNSLLNSKLITFFYREISQEGGRVLAQVKPQRIRQLPIPRSPIDNPTLQKPLVTLVDKILAAKGKDPLADTAKWEAEIDARVFHLYGLTEEEMLTVLNSFPKMSIVEKTQIQNFYRDLERGNLK